LPSAIISYGLFMFSLDFTINYLPYVLYAIILVLTLDILSGWSFRYFDKHFNENKNYVSLWQPRYYFSIMVIWLICAGYLYSSGGIDLETVLALLLCHLLLIASAIDLKYMYLPDLLILPLIPIGLFANYFIVFTTFNEAMLGAILGFGILWSVNSLFKLIRKKEGMGMGDFKLLGALGAWTGAVQLPLIIILSSFIGIALALIVNPLRGKHYTEPYPFGPALAIAGVICLLWGYEITMWLYN